MEGEESTHLTPPILNAALKSYSGSFLVVYCFIPINYHPRLVVRNETPHDRRHLPRYVQVALFGIMHCCLVVYECCKARVKRLIKQAASSPAIFWYPTM